ncbi:MAG: hypothetical protein HKN25_07075 [Pyrinomonadaceae bacterium]|nr:hypothetical protein [Pyrinomonadaceae bacterium]
MITTGQIKEILDNYRKFDWVLRRVLLTSDLKARLKDDLETIFADGRIIPSNIDAVWFSRVGKNDREAWELRILSENPFALLETFGKSDDEDQRDAVREEMQTRMAEFSSK